MYYLRTMAASAPIQFTVDQAALQQVDTAVANKPIKKRAARPVPAPMMEEKVTRNGIVTPSSEEESDDQHVEKLAVVATPVPVASPKKTNGVAKKKRDDMDEVERSIYDEAVIACSIEVSRSFYPILILEPGGV
jgi:ribonucleoside-diphosphate reductase subunit M1